MLLIVAVVLTEVTIKQEEDTAEEADNRSPAIVEEEVAVEESITGSPNNLHDRLAGPNVTADAGNQQPNGTSRQDGALQEGETHGVHYKVPVTTHCACKGKPM